VTDPVLRALLLTAGLFAVMPQAGAADDDRDTEMVCVPAEDGRTWECGTRANPPPPRGLTAIPRSGPTPAPPPFLAAPGVRRAPQAAAPATPPPRRDEFPQAPERDAPAEVTAVADAPAAATEPLADAGQAPVPVAVAEPRPAPAPTPDASTAVDTTGAAPAPPPMLAARRPSRAPFAPPPETETPAPATEPVAAEPVAAEPVAAEPVAADPVAADPVAAEPVAAEPVAAEPVAAEPVAAEPVAAEPVAAEPVAAEPVAAEPVAAEPVAAEPVAAEPVAAEPSEPVAAEPAPLEPAAPTDRADPPAIADPDAFLALSPARFTLQLARADRVGALYARALELRALGIDGRTNGALYIVIIDAGGTPQALLLWSDFANAESARDAWAALPGARPAAYPRRIAPLQDELRRAASRP
jgi:hypothetical protein